MVSQNSLSNLNGDLNNFFKQQELFIENELFLNNSFSDYNYDSEYHLFLKKTQFSKTDLNTIITLHNEFLNSLDLQIQRVKTLRFVDSIPCVNKFFFDIQDIHFKLDLAQEKQQNFQKTSNFEFLHHNSLYMEVNNSILNINTDIQNIITEVKFCDFLDSEKLNLIHQMLYRLNKRKEFVVDAQTTFFTENFPIYSDLFHSTMLQPDVYINDSVVDFDGIFQDIFTTEFSKIVTSVDSPISIKHLLKYKGHSVCEFLEKYNNVLYQLKIDNVGFYRPNKNEFKFLIDTLLQEHQLPIIINNLIYKNNTINTSASQEYINIINNILSGNKVGIFDYKTHFFNKLETSDNVINDFKLYTTNNLYVADNTQIDIYTTFVNKIFNNNYTSNIFNLRKHFEKKLNCIGNKNIKPVDFTNTKATLDNNSILLDVCNNYVCDTNLCDSIHNIGLVSVDNIQLLDTNVVSFDDVDEICKILSHKNDIYFLIGFLPIVFILLILVYIYNIFKNRK